QGSGIGAALLGAIAVHAAAHGARGLSGAILPGEPAMRRLVAAASGLVTLAPAGEETRVTLLFEPPAAPVPPGPPAL
ncbi:GNAT family N-acetyltransferase, partial [Falsiroseomonas oryzae]|uniref:hypothetical protein n=1 Tax=Falsiroseomonas oryzae TaxID=2766473 RepID=UPI0022EB4B52